MCLSTVYIVNEANEKKEVCNNIMSITLEGTNIICTNILGVRTVIEGVIDHIDLMDNFIHVKPILEKCINKG